MTANPGHKRVIANFSGRYRNNHRKELAVVRGELVVVNVQEGFEQHRSDTLVPVEERVVLNDTERVFWGRARADARRPRSRTPVRPPCSAIWAS